MSNWNDCEDVELILENLRINCINLSEYHRKRFYFFKSFGKYFRIPIIVLSSITASASVGLQPVMNQSAISGLTCVLGFGIAVILRIYCINLPSLPISPLFFDKDLFIFFIIVLLLLSYCFLVFLISVMS
jgi:hypothetical protein